METEKTPAELSALNRRLELRLSEAEEVIDRAHDAIGHEDYELGLAERVRVLRARCDGALTAIADGHAFLGPRANGDRTSLNGRMCDRLKHDASVLAVARAQADKLSRAIVEHHKQKADDRCWKDDDALYEAAGLPKVDRRVGSREEMLDNCRRFPAQRTEPGGWPTYAELEERNTRQALEIGSIRGAYAEIQAKLVGHEETIAAQSARIRDLVSEKAAALVPPDLRRGAKFVEVNASFGVPGPPLSTKGREFLFDLEERLQVTERCGRAFGGEGITSGVFCARQKGHEARGFPNHCPEGGLARAVSQPDGDA